MTTTEKSATERFTAALLDLWDARDRQLRSGDEMAVRTAWMDEERAKLAIQDAFNAAVDERVQQAIAYDRQP